MQLIDYRWRPQAYNILPARSLSIRELGAVISVVVALKLYELFKT